MSALKEMQKQIIMDHHRRPRHFGALSCATHTGIGDNPSCGDQVQLALRIEGGTIKQIRFKAKGCAISTASASLMTTLVEGKTVTEALELTGIFSLMMQTGQSAPKLGESAALQGVSGLHTRVKCASLGWQTLKLILEKEEAHEAQRKEAQTPA